MLLPSDVVPPVEGTVFDPLPAIHQLCISSTILNYEDGLETINISFLFIYLFIEEFHDLNELD